MRQVIESQAFSQFVLERLERPETDYEILFFDESIKSKLNRSKLKFTKEDTPFLKEKSYQVSSCISTLKPNYENIGIIIITLVERHPKMLEDCLYWDHALEIPARIIQPLLAESDFKLMRTYTSGLIQRAREAEEKRKQERWMRWGTKTTSLALASTAAKKFLLN
jgi:hypothetical protein